MHIKFMAHGTGSGSAAASYLMAEKDHKGEKREAVEVLRGNPEELGKLIDSLHFVQRYTSGVIAFAPDDKPTREDVDKLLTEFEKTAFAGLEGNQYSWAAVRHDEPEGGCHVHVIAARVELQSGKSLNIAPPGWESTFDHLRDAWNYEKNWARPDDPLRSRLVAPMAKDIHRSESPKEAINEWLTAQVEAGQISNRQDVLEALNGIGKINRVNPQYISVILEDGQKPIRLKGAIYAEQFSVSAILEAHSAARDGQGRDSGANREAAERAREQLQRAIERRAQYNQGRYERAPERDQPAIELSHPTNTQSLSSATRSISELMPIDRVRSRRLELVDDHRSESENGGSRSGRSSDQATDSRIDDRVLQHASGQSEMQLEQEIDEPKRKPKSKLQLDRERANGILEAISRVTAETRQNLNIVEQGAAQRTRANEQYAAADQPASRIAGAIRELADRINKSFERARELVREKLTEITKFEDQRRGKDSGLNR